MKIAVIELEFHVECLRTLAEMICFSRELEAVYVVNALGEKTLRNIVPDQNTINVRQPTETKQAFLERLDPIFTNTDLIFIATLEQHWKVYYPLVSKYPTVLRVHGLNYHFGKNGNFLKGISQLGVGGMLREWYWQNESWKKKVLEKVDFLTPTLHSSTYDDIIHANSNWVDVVPLSYNRITKQTSSDSFTIVIPGAVETARRDYHTVLRVMELLKKMNMRWVFLGKMVTREVQEAIEQLKQQGVNTHYYNKVVSDAEFEAVMEQSDLILAPVNEQHPFKTVTEIPGKTKISGATSDALYYQKPLLLPIHYPAQKIWEHLAYFYRSVDDLAEQIISLSKEPAQQSTTVFPIEKATAQLESIFTRCIKS